MATRPRTLATRAHMPSAETRPEVSFDSDFLQRLEYLNVIARKIMSGLMRADRKSARKGISPEFSDHRAYVPGDDIRHVDWHLYGRLEELFLKLYREEENLHMSILLDISSSMDLGAVHKLNYAYQVAAALAYIGMSNMDAVNLFAFNERLGDSRCGLKGKGRIFGVFDYLKGLEPTGITDLAACMKEFIGRERRRGVVIILSDFYDVDGYSQALKYLRYQRHDVYVIHLVDETEEKPDLRGDLRLMDSETDGFKEINITDGLMKRYREAFEKHASDVESFCIRNEMGYVRAHTHVPFDDLVLRILRRGGLIG